MVIRTVSTTDLPAVQNLIRASFDPLLHPYMVSTQQGAEHYLRVFVEFAEFHRDRYLILAESESNDLLAFAEFRLIDGGVGFLSYICVVETARGQGIAKKLIFRCLEHFSEIHTVQLDVFANNHIAKSLYERLGFQEISQNTWLIRPCPTLLVCETSNVNLKFENLPSSLANFERYNFCELSLSFNEKKIKLGRLGDNVLRCFQWDDYVNDTLLEEVRYAFPELNEVLFIAAADLNVDETIESREVVHSIRMEWAIPINIATGEQ